MERKLTIKNASGMTSAQIAAAGRKEKTELCIIMGAIMGTKIHDHPTYGVSTGFVGNFRSISLKDGQIREAPVFWPFAHLAEVIQMHRAQLNPGDILRLNIIIGVQPDTNSNVGYSYYYDFIEQPGETDMFADMMTATEKYLPAHIREKVTLAITGPKNEPEPEPSPNNSKTSRKK